MSESSSGNYLFAVFGFAALACGVVVVWSIVSGTYAGATKVPEPEFEQENFDDPHLTFSLDRSTTVQLSVEGTTLDDSWVWVKTLLVDDENRVLGDYTFELQEYSDDDETSWSKSFVLPAGQYKVLVHGKDAKRSQGWTDEHRERVRVVVQKGFVLTRYGLIGLVLFGIGAFLTMGSGRED